MALVCTLSVFLVLAVVLYSICAASSRLPRHIENRTLLFLPPAIAKPFEDLLAKGDVESVYRIMKSLHQRGEIHIIETRKQIVVTRTKPLPKDLGKIPVPDSMP